MKFFIFMLASLFALNAAADGATQFFNNNLKRIDVEIAGKGILELRTDIPNTRGKESMCFNKINMIDRASGQIIGEATDCLSNIKEKNGGLKVLGTTYLHFFADGDNVETLIIQGKITVQPVAANAKTAWGMNATHITGASAKAGKNSIIGGTGKYEGATGNSRISGMVNMNKLEDERNPHIKFSCWIEIFLELADWAIE